MVVFFRLTILLFVVFLFGCQSTGVVQMSPNVYEISRSSAAGAFADIAHLKASVVREANAFAYSQGKVSVPIDLSVSRPAVGFPSCTYRFEIIYEDDYNYAMAKKQQEWDSLSPEQKMTFQLQAQENALREQSIRLSAEQARQKAHQDWMNRRAYAERTDAINRPIQVDVNGQINHNVNGTIRHDY